MKMNGCALTGLVWLAGGCGAKAGGDTAFESSTATATPNQPVDDGSATQSEGTATGGAGEATGASASGGSDDGNCQEYVVRNERVTPDMLIVLDRSGSMKRRDVNRWDPSVAAIKAVTGQLDSLINSA